MQNLSNDRYRIVLKIVECGSLSRAADALGYTQSGISHVVAGVEKELGFQLFVRRRSGVELTEKGKSLLPYFREVVRAEDHLNEMVFRTNHEMEGRLRIGSFASVTNTWLPDVISWYREHYPNVEIEILDGNYDEIRGWIASGIADVGFLTDITAKDLSFAPLCEDPVCVIMPEGHPLEKKEQITIQDVLAYPLILPVPGWGNVTDHLFDVSGTHPQPIFQFRDDQEIAVFVRRGFGISLSQDLIQQSIHSGLPRRHLFPGTSRIIGTACLPSQNSILVQSFLHLMPTLLSKISA